MEWVAFSVCTMAMVKEMTERSFSVRSWDATSTMSCCEWVGITCDDSFPARVVSLSLHIAGSLPQALANISSLQILDLSYNGLSGHIPNELTSLSRLQQLDLSNNHLSEILSQGRCPFIFAKVVHIWRC
ncbi:hypothetical protein GOP47_0016022 [Adiantum capillus-veneris]|uniref:Leucine-rich repeat-containing N-terminal plant-type domain-containing protein n=1 Tax=Adiantum capillus-veneris TaxID=13818 RepID=A0A9D4ULN3_ADICA|nr:hypothetical protein GOP47_0016022 [Adiantum capillus-veneris]